MVDADVVSCCLHALVLKMSQILFWEWRNLNYITDAETDLIAEKLE